MVFFRTLRCAQKHINYNTKQHFDEWRSNFYSLQNATNTLKKQSKIHFLGAETPPNRSSENCETLANGNKILAISMLPGGSGGTIHLPPTSHLAKKTTGDYNLFNDLCRGHGPPIASHLLKQLWKS